MTLGTVATRRRGVDVLFWTCCFGALAAVITPTLWMLIGVVSRALPVFRFSVLVQDSQGNGAGCAMPSWGPPSWAWGSCWSVAR